MLREGRTSVSVSRGRLRLAPVPGACVSLAGIDADISRTYFASCQIPVSIWSKNVS